MITVLKYKDLQKAWEGMNEYLFVDERKIVETDTGGAFGSQMVCLDTIIEVDKAEVDSTFDFGEKLGYARTKWTTLVNNYVNYYYLDMLRSEVSKRENQRARMYNYTLHFANKYGSGKDCLISLTVARRPNRDLPFASFVIRTSEITKRLLFDFLLVQRILEYLYGTNEIQVNVYAQHWYITAESFVMYNNIKSIRKLAKLNNIYSNPAVFQDKILKKFKEYMNHPDPFNVMFRVNRRSMLQIQRDSNGKPLSGVKPLIAKDLTLKPIVNYPGNVMTRTQVLNYQRNNGK